MNEFNENVFFYSKYNNEDIWIINNQRKSLEGLM